MDAREAIETYCHVSQRDWKGTIYTIQDVRADAFNGKNIRAELLNGKVRIFWMDEKTTA